MRSSGPPKITPGLEQAVAQRPRLVDDAPAEQTPDAVPAPEPDRVVARPTGPADASSADTLDALTDEDRPRISVGLRLPEPLVERLRDANAAVRGLTITDIVERGAALELLRILEDYEAQTGEALPRRPRPVRL